MSAKITFFIIGTTTTMGLTFGKSTADSQIDTCVWKYLDVNFDLPRTKQNVFYVSSFKICESAVKLF